MNTLYDKTILFCCCLFLMIFRQPQIGLLHVISVLVTVIFTCISSCLNLDLLSFRQLNTKEQYGISFTFLLFAILILIHPAFGIFFPFLFYEMTVCQFSGLYLCVLLLPLFSFRAESIRFPLIVWGISLMAYVMVYKTGRLYRLEKEYKLLRDTSTEGSLLLKQKNKDLLEKQDYEIHVATLKERNRIAREIHDNVGHLLSRSILQAGALMAVHTQESLKEPMAQLKDSLSLAMDSIRKSVHDLHDESIDLHSAIAVLLTDFSDYEVHFDYDLESIVPQSVKYCFISIVKESLSNISRHSNATDIEITLREHPNLYQLFIIDNGSDIRRKNTGIGLQNMKDRVDSLKGHIVITTDRGFRIFVSIPRNI